MIKKKIKFRNTYFLSPDKIWIRRPTSFGFPRDINHLIGRGEHDLLIRNEIQNKLQKIPIFEPQQSKVEKYLIVSDGFGFSDISPIISDLSKDVYIIATNGSLARWRSDRRINLYVTNNPFRECLSYLPSGKLQLPRCIASSRTNPDFTREYSKRGQVYRYEPTPDHLFSSNIRDTNRSVDDYRNSICAALSIAHQLSAKKIILCCCDDCFEGHRPGSEKMKENLYWYEPNRISHNIIDTLCYAIKDSSDNDIRIRSFPGLKEYENAPYIEPKDIGDFYNE